MIFEEMNYDIEDKINNWGIIYPHNLFIGFWPMPETDDDTEHHITETFRAIACTYQTELQICSHPEEIIVSDNDKRPWISIEEHRQGVESTGFDEFVFPAEAIYIVGNSEWRHMSDALVIDHVVTIPTPGGYKHPLYGTQAAAIVLQAAALQRLSGDSEESQASSVSPQPVEPAQT